MSKWKTPKQTRDEKQAHTDDLEPAENTVEIAPMADGVLAPPDLPLDLGRAGILCDSNGREVGRVAHAEGRPHPWRVTHNGKLYEHTGEDAEGRWIYLESR